MAMRPTSGEDLYLRLFGPISHESAHVMDLSSTIGTLLPHRKYLSVTAFGPTGTLGGRKPTHRGMMENIRATVYCMREIDALRCDVVTELATSSMMTHAMNQRKKTAYMCKRSC